MSDKINTRNKFARKICSKMEKLNNDIKLLIKVDSALKNQSGGGLLNDISNAIADVEKPDVDLQEINQEILAYGNTLSANITSLTVTLQSILYQLRQLAEDTNVVVPKNNVTWEPMNQVVQNLNAISS